MFDTPIGRRAMLRRLSLALGGLATVPLASGILSGCRTPESGALADYTYQTLTADQQRQFAAMVEQIIPTTDTPGAADAGVPQFVDLMLTDWYTPEERDAFLAGLAAANQRAEGGSFADLDAEAQATLIAAMDAEEFGEAMPESADESPAEETASDEGSPDSEMQLNTGEGETETEVDENGNATSGASDGPSFYRQLKELTVTGYYTSEVGASQELQWNPAPGRLDADVPLSEIGRAWA